MKEILLSSVLLVALAFTGCDDDTTTAPDLDTTSTTGSVFTDIGDINVTEGNKAVATFKPQDPNVSYTYRITGGADASYFVIDGNALNFKTAQTYLEGGSNSFVVEVTATNDTTAKSAAPTTFHINVVPQAVIVTNPEDTTAPVITTLSSYTINPGAAITLTATDENAVNFTETSNMFTISGTTLTPEFATGTNSVVVTATDTAGNSSDKNITVTVKPVVIADPTVRTATTPYIASDVVDFKGKTWLKIKGSASGDDDIMAADGVTTAYAFRQKWSDAQSICQTLSLDGGGWHLPTRDEAKILIDNFVELAEDASGTIHYRGDLNSTIVAPQSDVANAVIWTNDGTGEGIFFGNKEFNYTNTDVDQTFSFTCVK